MNRKPIAALFLRRVLIIAATALVLVACGEGSLGGGGGGIDTDPGDAADTGADVSTDAPCVRLCDGGEDSGSPDTGTADSGGDTGEVDSGEPDTGEPDTDPGDVGAPDSGAGVIVERGGLVVIEAESYDEVETDGPRQWLLTTPSMTPSAGADPDPNHADGASASAYLEALPDTRVTHDDPIMGGTNFFGRGGQGPALTYNVRFTGTGRYIIWMRAYSTGTEDNGAHVGLDGEWPSSGERVQWCAGKNQWTWSSAQRDAGGSACGRPRSVSLMITEPGMHQVTVSMREDGFEFDKLILAADEAFEPEGAGPDEARE